MSLDPVAADTLPAAVLVVEDETVIAANLMEFLEMRGFRADVAYDADMALQLLASQRFDAMVLDLGLPGRDGYHVLQTVRETLRLTLPVLILTARASLQDKATGFGLGADDFLTKPFALEEVQMRLRALLQRSGFGRPGAAHWAHGPLVFDPGSRDVSVHGTRLHLPRKSVQILEVLLRRPGTVVTRGELETLLWQGEPPSSEAVRSQIHLLRRALQAAGYSGLETVHGTGWRLAEDAV